MSLSLQLPLRKAGVAESAWRPYMTRRSASRIVVLRGHDGGCAAVLPELRCGALVGRPHAVEAQREAERRQRAFRTVLNDPQSARLRIVGDLVDALHRRVR